MDGQSLDNSLESAINGLTQLIAFPSVSSASNVAINDWCADRLASLGFEVTFSRYEDHNGTEKANLVAVRRPLAIDATSQHVAEVVSTFGEQRLENPSRAREGSSEARGRASSEASPQPVEGGAVNTANSQAGAGERAENPSRVREGSSEARGRASGERESAQSSTGLAYFCHTDVVPAEQWTGADSFDPKQADPFQARIVGPRLYGRGACDMKGSLSAMLSAVARVEHADQTKPLWIVCTADEEVGFGGAKHLSEHCAAYQELAARDPLSIIGEPTELKVVHAHKGIRGFRVRSTGRAGHSATHYGINANEAMVPMLAKLLELCHRTRAETQWQDARFDPALLSWNFGVSDHSDVINITPERSDAWCSLWTMPEIDGQDLIDEVVSLASELGLSTKMIEGCDPLWTDPLHPDIQTLEVITKSKAHSVCYATDGGVLRDLSKRVVLGPGSIQQAHTIDEWISLEQLGQGIQCFETAIRHWCC